MTDKLRDALEKLHQAVCGETGFAAAVRQESGKAYPWPALDIADDLARAALAAAPQPAPEEGLTRAQVGAMLDAKRHDREALVEVIREAWQSHEAALRAVLAERDALQGQLNDLRNGWANSVKAHSGALAERDAAFAAGQEEMRERAADATLYLCRMKGMGNRTIDGPEAAHLIRDLPIKGRVE